MKHNGQLNQLVVMKVQRKGRDGGLAVAQRWPSGGPAVALGQDVLFLLFQEVLYFTTF